MRNKDLKKNLNLSFMDYVNQTYSVGKYDFPYIKCPDINIDYLALYSNIKDYEKTSRTAICFFQYDREFDGIKGLYNAIYYDDKRLLEQYKNRFANVKYMIFPDYSQCGDVSYIENVYRLFKARIVALWFILEMEILAIPNITYANENYFDIMLDGLEDSNMVAFSVMGSIKEKKQKKLLKNAIEFTVTKMIDLKTIIVYSVCSNDEEIYELFDYAISKGVQVIIPDNILKSRNVERSGESNGKN